MNDDIDIEGLIVREHTEAYLRKMVDGEYRAWYARRQQRVRAARVSVAALAVGIVGTVAVWLAGRPMEGTMVADGGVTVTCSDGAAAADMLARTERIYALI